MSIRDEIERLIERDDDLSRMKLDIIRILAIFNGVSWKTEIIPDILKLRGGLADYQLREELLDQALSDLESSRIISIEPRIRGAPLSSEVYEDKLIKLVDLSAARRALARDPIYLGYMRMQMEAIRRALENHV